MKYYKSKKVSEDEIVSELGTVFIYDCIQVDAFQDVLCEVMHKHGDRYYITIVTKDGYGTDIYAWVQCDKQYIIDLVHKQLSDSLLAYLSNVDEGKETPLTNPDLHDMFDLFVSDLIENKTRYVKVIEDKLFR